MWDIYNSITEDQSGLLKAELSEDDLNLLRKNPFHLTDTDIRVSYFCGNITSSSSSAKYLQLDVMAAVMVA